MPATAAIILLQKNAHLNIKARSNQDCSPSQPTLRIISLLLLLAAPFKWIYFFQDKHSKIDSDNTREEKIVYVEIVCLILSTHT